MEPEDIGSQSRTSDTDSSERESTATYNGTIKTIKTNNKEPTSPTTNQIKQYPSWEQYQALSRTRCRRKLLISVLCLTTSTSHRLKGTLTR